MTQLQGTPFAFDQNNEMHRKAQHYLETMDREKFPSFGDVMITAIVDYFDRYYAEQDKTPAEDGLEARVAKIVEETLEKKLPEIIAPLLEGAGDKANANANATEGVEQEEESSAETVDLGPVEKEINWGFLGG